ncbi:MAG: hypothetical protein J3Q66DRAFT_358236 [Benniella sp.]|nr:MAG: hypothetical protein J3Q66DRAFT_358236 [Benniella sp.]
MNDSRPGSALSTYNMVGGTQETSLTMGFADMTSLTGHSSPYSHQQQQSDPDTTTGSNSILSPLRTSSVVAIPTVGSGSRISANSGAGATAGGSAQSSSSAASGADQKRKRKRREMQPVSKTIESLEPYQDNYLWKNNGNTTQKKTGCKSIYYKCSNSAGGCTVNKTVTAKEGGGYTTKYRGEHREDCKKQMRPQLSAQSVSISQHTYALQGAQ